MSDFDDVNLSSSYLSKSVFKDYYLSLSQPIRDKLDDSEVEISTIDDLKQVVAQMK